VSRGWFFSAISSLQSIKKQSAIPHFHHFTKLMLEKKMKISTLRPFIIAATIMILGGNCFSKAATFQGLGFLPGSSGCFARAVSADGKVVVGSASVGSSSKAFRWTSSTGMTDFGSSGAPESVANAVSPDGQIAVGYNTTQVHTDYGPVSVKQAFGWKTNGQVLNDFRGPPIANWAIAYGVSNNGIVVGVVSEYGPPDRTYGFRGDNRLIGIGNGSAAAWGISADGNTVFGESDFFELESNAYRRQATIWTNGNNNGIGLRGLMGAANCTAYAASADGSVIVGESDTGSGHEAVLWARNESDEAKGLGLLPGDLSSVARAVSGNGKIVVGSSGCKLFIWDEDNGMRNLQDVLENQYGIDLAGWRLISVDGVSADGSVIVGYGTNPSGFTESWIVTIPEPSSLVILLMGAFGLVALLKQQRHQ
jgi:probable HAF family extracellular repeat protein